MPALILGLCLSPVHGQHLSPEFAGDGTRDPADMPALLGGEISNPGDGARFTECLTGRSYSIAAGSEAGRLQRAYRADARTPGAALYVTLEGTLTQRPGTQGGRPEPTVVVQRFIGTWPGHACERARADASLVNAYWRIVRLGDRRPTVAAGRREPHLILRQSTEGLSYAATVGCNPLVGTFQVTGDQLTFERAETTVTACPSPLAEFERRLGEMLDAARHWQIRGSTLELRDAAGGSIALLEAVYF